MLKVAHYFFAARCADRQPAAVFAASSSHRGKFLGIDTFTDNAATRVRISERKADGQGRRFFIANSQGDRLHELPAEKSNYEPGNRPWCQVAMENRGRVFTPLSVSSNNP